VDYAWEDDFVEDNIKCEDAIDIEAPNHGNKDMLDV